MPNQESHPNRPTRSEPEDLESAQWLDPYDTSYRRDWAIISLLLISALAAYLPAVGGHFIWGDERAVVANEAVRSIRTLGFAWIHPGASTTYRPLADTAYFLQRAIWQDWNPSGYHIISIVFHLLNTWLVALLLLRLKLRGALPAACLFALHPATVQSVAWIAQQPQLLAGLFSLLSALVYLTASGLHPPPFEIEGGFNFWHRKRLLWVLVWLLQLTALLADAPVACGVPLALLTILWWKRGRIERTDIAAVAVPISLSVVITAIAAWTARSQASLPGIAQLSLAAARGAWLHLFTLIVPYPLTFAGAPAEGTGRWSSWLSLLMLLLTIALIYSARRRVARGVIAALLIYLILLIGPIIFPTPIQPGVLMDSQAYLARISWFALISAAIMRLVPHDANLARRVLRRGACFCAVIVLIVLTWRQAETYRDDLSVWTHTLRHHPDSSLARIELGKTLLARDDLDEAAAEFRQVIERDPANVEAMLQLAAVYQRQSKYLQAMQQLDKAAQMQPRNGSVHRQLAAAAAEAGNVESAIRHYQTAVQLDSHDDIAMNNLATIYARQGQLDRAEAEYRNALAANPHATKARLNLANLLFGTGKMDEAAEHLQRAVQLDPNNFDLYLTAGGMLLNVKDFHNAARMFRHALRLRRGEPQAFNGLGVALAAQAQYEEAIYNFGRAIDLDPNFDAARKNLAAAQTHQTGNSPSSRGSQ